MWVRSFRSSVDVVVGVVGCERSTRLLFMGGIFRVSVFWFFRFELLRGFGRIVKLVFV